MRRPGGRPSLMTRPGGRHFIPAFSRVSPSSPLDMLADLRTEAGFSILTETSAALDVE